MQGWRAPLDEGVSGWVVRHNEAQLVNDMLADPRGALVPGTELVAAARSSSAQCGRQGHRRARHRPMEGKTFDDRARAGQAVREPGGHRHPERQELRAARPYHRSARGPGRPAAQAVRPQRGAAQHARPARRVRPDHHDAQGDRRLRRHGHPPRRRGGGRAGLHLLARHERRGDARLPHPRRSGGQRLGRAPQRGAADQRHDPRPAHRAGARHRGGGAAGVHHRAAQRARHGHRRPLPGPHGRPHLRRSRAGARQAVRQPRGHRHPERAQL